MRPWCPARTDAGEEWLLLTYEDGVRAAAVELHANLNPGAVVRVTSLGEDGVETGLWSGTPATKGAFVRKITLNEAVPVKRLKLYFDTAALGLVPARGDLIHGVAPAANRLRPFWGYNMPVACTRINGVESYLAAQFLAATC